MGLTSKKTKKTKSQKRRRQLPDKTRLKNFFSELMPEHQQAFNVVKEALVTALSLGYQDFNREFMIETDASLQGLGAIISQQDETGKLCVIAFCKSIFTSIREIYVHL